MDNAHTTKQSLVVTCNALIKGLTAMPGIDTVTCNGVTYTRAELLAPLTAYVPLPEATTQAKTAYTKAVAAEGVAREAAVAMIDDVLEPLLRQRLGKDSADLEALGLDPVKTPQKSAAVKAAAAQKAQATRKALGTKGTVQKKAAKKALEAQPATPAAATAPEGGSTPPATATKS
ncbi:MAG TPA: hypothetical protein VGG39_07965 [Polyangiaceae bacterium]